MRNQRRSLSYVVYLCKRIISFTLRLFFMKSHAGDWYIYDSSLIDFKTNFLSKIIKTKHKTFRKRKDKAFSWNFLFKNQWLWPSARHFKEVTVTLSKVTVTLKWRADGQGHLEWCHFKWPSLAKFSKNFFLLFFCILGNFTLFWHHFSIFIFYTVTVTLKWRADGHVIISDHHF